MGLKLQPRRVFSPEIDMLLRMSFPLSSSGIRRMMDKDPPERAALKRLEAVVPKIDMREDSVFHMRQPS